MDSHSKRQLRALRQAADAARSTAAWQGIAVLGGFLAAALYAFHSVTESWLHVLVLLFLLVIGGWLLTRRQTSWLLRLMTSRPGESICGFARFFPRRSVDPVLLRAVYEGVQQQMGQPRVPVRATDRLTADLRLDSEDIDEIYWEVADICGYATEEGEQNPFRGKVETVADLVYFLQHQPRTFTHRPL